MHFTTAFLLAAAAGLATAQSSTSASSPAAPTASSVTSSSGCGSAVDVIISTCLSSTQAILNACSPDNWGCMCKAQQSVVTCYNNCPDDPAGAPARQQELSWCNAAKANPSPSSSAFSAASTTAGASSTAASAMKTTAVHSGFASGASSSAGAQSTGAAAPMLVPGSGLAAAAVLGLAML